MNNMFVFWDKFHWSVFLMVQFSVSALDQVMACYLKPMLTKMPAAI